MPRPNPIGSIESEANLARRIKREREKRGLSYEAFARSMADNGCPIQGSAIYKIEKGTPRRRISVDELVAISGVLGTSIDDLLTPLEVLDRDRAQEVLKELQTAEKALSEALTAVLSANAEFLVLANDAQELFEYVRGHKFEAIFELDDIEPIAHDEYEDTVLALFRALLRAGAEVARKSVGQPAEGSDDNGEHPETS